MFLTVLFDEGEGMEDKREEAEPPTTNFDSDHAEEARRRYDGSNSGAFIAAAGEPSTEHDFIHRATDLEKASARLGENQERHDTQCCVWGGVPPSLSLRVIQVVSCRYESGSHFQVVSGSQHSCHMSQSNDGCA